MNSRKLLLAVAAVLSTVALEAQSIKINPKYGAISDEEMQMTRYDADTSAASVLLYDFQELTIGYDNKLDLGTTCRIHKRFKILKESGKDDLDFKIRYQFSTGYRGHVSSINVTTYNLEDGKKVATKLSKKLIFDEKYSENMPQVSFAPEKVQVGSVVEVAFELTTSDIEIGRVYIQHETIPVNYGVLEVRHPDRIGYKRLQHGFHPVGFENTSENKKVLAGGDMYSYNEIIDRYTALDLPALGKESYCMNASQYLSSVDYVISSFGFENYNSSWSKVDEAFRSSDFFKQFTARLKFDDDIKAAAASVDDEKEKIAAIRKVVISNVKWNEEWHYFPNVSKAVKEGEGDAADINGIMGSALNMCGFNVSPVLIRSRRNGQLMDFHVDMDSFTNVILKVTCPSGAVYFIDAAPGNSYLNVISPNFLVDKARVMSKEGYGSWESLTPLAKGLTTQSVTMDVAADGTITGTCKRVASGESSYVIKGDFHDAKDEDEYLQELEEEEKLEVTEFKAEKADEWTSDISMEYNFEMEAEKNGDYIYVRPIITPFHSDADFKAETRKIPVDFPYNEDIVYSCVVKIPEGYAVEQLPEPLVMRPDGLSSRIVFQCREVGGVISVSMRYSRGIMFVNTPEYPILRAYWAQLCNIYKNTIVLKKI